MRKCVKDLITSSSSGGVYKALPLAVLISVYKRICLLQYMLWCKRTHLGKFLLYVKELTSASSCCM